jgi:hypothetical protein
MSYGNDGHACRSWLKWSKRFRCYICMICGAEDR